MWLSNKAKPKRSEDPDLFGHPGWEKETPILTAHEAVEFVLAGKAKITLRSEKTGKHYTFKIRKSDGESWFVSRLTGGNCYRYLGTIFPDGFRSTRKSEHLKYHWLRESFEAFDWFWRRLNADQQIPADVTLFHAGRCGMCGLELTDPVSVKEGYGPDCRKKRLRRSFMCVR